MDSLISSISDYDYATSNACFSGKNKTSLFTNVYEGIPETLMLNVIAWIFLVILFTLLRQQAWDYGRLALVNSRGDKRWTQLFYAQGNDDGNSAEQLSTNNGRPSSGSIDSNIRHSGTSTHSHSHNDRGFLSWIPITFKLKKEQILMHSGPDAVHYLSFQQHLIAVMAIITFVAIVIILPVNFQGDLSGDVNSFGHTTISNLSPNSPLLWIHVFFAIVYVPLVVLIMRRSSGRYAGKVAPTRTIMATNISQSDCNKTIIRNYIKELFPDIDIEDIQLTYNVATLTDVVNEFEKVVEARIYCETHKNRDGPIKVFPSCYTCKAIDALEYYKEKEERLQGEVARLKASALNDPLGIAFITLSSADAAQHIILHFRPGTYREWTLAYAPAPSDLFWENLNVSSGQWYFKWAVVNAILFLFLFFLTTPVLIVNMLNQFSISRNATSKISKVSPLISEFLPTLLLWTLSALMPVIVAYSDKWLSHWTRSKQNYSIMTKSFGYLLFMILILPSLGLTSAQAFLDWTLHYSDNDTYRWDCIFLPDKGAFFVNYVITAAFIGTALELLRFPELIVYMWMLCTTKSRAETPHIRKSIVVEFPYGVHYAWTIMVFTMSVVYSLACPLIMPFAMVYVGFKHFIDRHNLYFAYRYSNMISQGGGKIHSTAVTMTKFSVVLLLIIMAALASVRGAGLDPRGIVLIISLCLTLVMFTFMSPIKKCTTRPPTIVETEGPAPLYIADVFLNKRIHVPESPSQTSYGSDNVHTVIIDEQEIPIRTVTTTDDKHSGII